MDRSDLVEPFKGWSGQEPPLTVIDGQPIRGTRLSDASMALHDPSTDLSANLTVA